MAYPGATIYSLDRSGIHQVRDEETEHYAVTKHFLQDPLATLGRISEEVEQDIKR